MGEKLPRQTHDLGQGAEVPQASVALSPAVGQENWNKVPALLAAGPAGCQDRPRAIVLSHGARAEESGAGRLRVVFPRVSGVPAEFEQIRKIILEILPCHLDVEFYFRYLTWAECEGAGYTWAAVDKAEYTWEGFQLAVPPEE